MICVLMAALASCATLPVTPLGDDLYRITASAPMEQNVTPAEMALSRRRVEETHREVTRRANEYCARRQLRAVEVEDALSVQSAGNSEGPIDLATAQWVGIRTLTFRCAPTKRD